MKDDATNIMRTRVRAMKDNREGWASVASNLGRLYLQEDPWCAYKVNASTPLLKELGSSEVVRNLEQGEFVEMLGFLKEESPGQNSTMRMKLWANKDGATGWASIFEADKVILGPVTV